MLPRFRVLYSGVFTNFCATTDFRFIYSLRLLARPRTAGCAVFVAGAALIGFRLSISRAFDSRDRLLC